MERHSAVDLCKPDDLWLTCESGNRDTQSVKVLLDLNQTKILKLSLDCCFCVCVRALSALCTKRLHVLLHGAVLSVSRGGLLFNFFVAQCKMLNFVLKSTFIEICFFKFT